ncbi:MAG: GNAT family N-acetyltransferase [Methylomonas sp.]|nr:MAG: GNAT family N-acetyltransferase [Methylomonas sp.]
MNSSIILNLSQESQHIPTLAAWHHQEWAHLNPGGTLEKRIAKMQTYLDVALVPSTYIYKQDDQLAGSAALIACDMDTRPELTPWLASVFVSPPFRRQGIGSALVRYAMLQAKLAGLDTLYLFTPDQAGFYAKLGWQTLSEESYRGCDITLMHVHLADWTARSFS